MLRNVVASFTLATLEKAKISSMDTDLKWTLQRTQHDASLISSSEAVYVLLESPKYCHVRRKIDGIEFHSVFLYYYSLFFIFLLFILMNLFL